MGLPLFSRTNMTTAQVSTATKSTQTTAITAMPHVGRSSDPSEDGSLADGSLAGGAGQLSSFAFSKSYAHFGLSSTLPGHVRVRVKIGVRVHGQEGYVRATGFRCRVTDRRGR